MITDLNDLVLNQRTQKLFITKLSASTLKSDVTEQAWDAVATSVESQPIFTRHFFSL